MSTWGAPTPTEGVAGDRRPDRDGPGAAAGLNAYIPFLLVALLARFSDVVVLPTGLEWMESWWAIGVGALLLLVELTLDKVPVVDSINDAVQTFIRPSMGGLMGAATAGASSLDQSTWMQQNPWVGVLLGVAVSGVVHTGKVAARPVVNAGTLGTGAPVVSAAEDGASFGITLIALFLPVLVVLVLLLLAAALIQALRLARRLRPRSQRVAR